MVRVLASFALALMSVPAAAQFTLTTAPQLSPGETLLVVVGEGSVSAPPDRMSLRAEFEGLATRLQRLW